MASKGDRNKIVVALTLFLKTEFYTVRLHLANNGLNDILRMSTLPQPAVAPRSVTGHINIDLGGAQPRPTSSTELTGRVCKES
jgi:hypothetical protein